MTVEPRCFYDVDDSPFDNRCLRRAVCGSFCVQHAKIVMKYLAAARDEKLTWNQRGLKVKSFRLWEANDNTYTVANRRQVNFLHREGFMKDYMAAGYAYVNRGYCELTTTGRVALKEIESELLAALLSPPVGPQPDEAKMEEAMDDFARHTTPGGTWIFEDESGEPRE